MGVGVAIGVAVPFRVPFCVSFAVSFAVSINSPSSLQREYLQTIIKVFCVSNRVSNAVSICVSNRVSAACFFACRHYVIHMPTISLLAIC